MDPIKIEKWITTWWGMWLAFFVYTAVLAFFVQLIVLPYFLPSMDYGHGLFVPDSTWFHQVAQDQASAMMKDGWKAWRLFPKNSYPAGIASIFYYLWYPEPFALVPFNAALHATAGCLVLYLLSSFIQDRMAAFGGAVLFVLNPASLEWTSQIHRDGTFILGNLLVLSAWFLISKSIKTEKWHALICSAFIFFMGILLIWASRFYWIYVVAGACAVLLAVIFFYMIIAWYKNRSIKSHHVAPVFLVCIMLVMQIPFMEKGSAFMESIAAQQQGNMQTTYGERVIEKKQFKGKAAIQNHIRGMIVIEGQYKGVFLPDKIEWHFSPCIPMFIESKLHVLAECRLGATIPGGRSLIDPEVQFMSAKDYLLYLPRALQVGFLSPFPSMWFTAGAAAGTTVGRTILGIVTMFFYVCIAFFFWSLRIYGKSRNFWLAFLYSSYGLLVLTYTYPNVGILNRMRYGFYMVIVSIGFAFMIQELIKFRRTTQIRH